MDKKKETKKKNEDYVSPLMTRKLVETENSFADSKEVTVGTGTTPIKEDWGTDDTSINGSISL
jgi:hypothetical protein